MLVDSLDKIYENVINKSKFSPAVLDTVPRIVRIYHIVAAVRFAEKLRKNCVQSAMFSTLAAAALTRKLR